MPPKRTMSPENGMIPKKARLKENPDASAPSAPQLTTTALPQNNGQSVQATTQPETSYCPHALLRLGLPPIPFEDILYPDDPKANELARTSRKNAVPPGATQQETAEPIWSLLRKQSRSIIRILKGDSVALRFQNDFEADCTASWGTGIWADFSCPNVTCEYANKKASIRVPVTVRLYANDRFNSTMRHPRCFECDTACEFVGFVRGQQWVCALRVAEQLREWYEVTFRDGQRFVRACVVE